MATEIIMPKAGMDMEEGTVIKWLKNVGDKVKKGEPILEVLTDKVNMEVEAEETGTLLKITAEEGDVLPVFTIIGYIGEEGEKIDNNEVNEAEKEEELDIDKVRATPAARRVAKDKSLDITKISGTGPMGRIQLSDVTSLSDNENLELIPESNAKTEIQSQEENKTSGNTILNKQVKKAMPFTGIRKVIADKMIESQKTSATVTLNCEVDMTNTIVIKNKLRDRIYEDTECKMTFTDLLIMVVTKALIKYPIVNSQLKNNEIIIHDFVNLGIAVGMENGLIVPVIKDTDKMTLEEIVISRTDIIDKTHNNMIEPNDLNGSTFTISNLGMYDILSFNSIINQPNSAILSVGAIVERMRIIESSPMVRSVMNISITFDHRVMDGVIAAQFLKYLKGLLEDPVMLIV